MSVTAHNMLVFIELDHLFSYDFILRTEQRYEQPQQS